MNTLFSTEAVYAVIVLAAFVIVMAIINLIHTRNIMKSLSMMLDQAISGDFNTAQIDESMLSALEFKLARYLGDMDLAFKNLSYEKNQINTLISDISHQTKTPISNIMLYSELLLEQELNDSCRGYSKALNAQAKKLNFLIISLIKMSRLETGILTLNPKSESITPLIDEAYVQLLPKAADKGLYFNTEFSDKKIQNTEIKAVFDAKWTLEALCNIIDNAIKYTDRGGIIIKTSAYEIFCRIDIIDTGCGIAEDEQAQIFSRFYRSAQASDKEGVGIGLYLAREIIAKEGGYIKLSSTSGNGSTFSIFLPMEINV